VTDDLDNGSRDLIELASLDVGDGAKALILSHPKAGAYWVVRGVSPIWQKSSSVGPYLASVPAGTLAAGELAPDATDVDVTAVESAVQLKVAAGRYLALLSGNFRPGEVFAVARGPQGSIVPWPVPKELQRTAVDIPNAICPACGATAWDLVEVSEGLSPGSRTLVGIVCNVCGWREDNWELSSGLQLKGDAEEFLGAVDVVRACTFPVYGLATSKYGRATVASHVWRGPQLVSVSLSYRDTAQGDPVVEISSTAREGVVGDLLGIARHKLREATLAQVASTVVRTPPSSERALGAEVLSRSHPLLEAIEIAQPLKTIVSIEDLDVECCALQEAGMVSAAGWHGPVQITLVAHAGVEMAELQLVRILHPERFISEPVDDDDDDDDDGDQW
jgi:hypothetical protein